MQNATESMQALERATEKNQKEIVVELGLDRILHYIGVYLILFVAIVAKITEVAGPKLSCYPARNVTPKSGFITYSESYCWETSQLTSTGINISCNLQDIGVRKEILMKEPVLYKTFIQWLPYVMILEACLLSIPSLAWHSRVGASLMGHLKFMQILLNDVYETVKPIPTGIYTRDGAYDRKSYYLDGWNQYDRDYKLENFRTIREREKKKKKKEEEKKQGGANRNLKLRKIKPDEESGMSGTTPLLQTNDSTNTKETSFLYGNVRDRNLFSMLCYENFSSLEQLPYILSVYKLTAKQEKPSYKGFIGPKTKCILRLVCNENNFSGRFLIRTYYMKHAFGFLVALAAFIATIVVLNLLWPDLWTSESFQCDVIYHEEECMICTMKRKRDMLAFLIINLVVDLLYMGLSLGNVVFLRTSENRALCKYFEEIADTGSVALVEKPIPEIQKKEKDPEPGNEQKETGEKNSKTKDKEVELETTIQNADTDSQSTSKEKACDSC